VVYTGKGRTANAANAFRLYGPRHVTVNRTISKACSRKVFEAIGEPWLEGVGDLIASQKYMQRAARNVGWIQNEYAPKAFHSSKKLITMDCRSQQNGRFIYSGDYAWRVLRNPSDVLERQVSFEDCQR
jgi:hypothetical protein